MNAMQQQVEYEAAFLDVCAAKSRARGFFDMAVAYENLAYALRNGQLTLGRYLTSWRWGAVFGGGCVGG